MFPFPWLQNSPQPPPAVDGVRPEEVIETSAVCIFYMAKDPANHPIFISDAELVHILSRYVILADQ